MSKPTNCELKKKKNMQCHTFLYWKDTVGASKYGINSFWHFKVEGKSVQVFHSVYRYVSPHQLNVDCTGTTHKDKKDWACLNRTGYTTELTVQSAQATCPLFLKGQTNTLVYRTGQTSIARVWPCLRPCLVNDPCWLFYVHLQTAVERAARRARPGDDTLLSWRLMLCWAEIGR